MYAKRLEQVDDEVDELRASLEHRRDRSVELEAELEDARKAARKPKTRSMSRSRHSPNSANRTQMPAPNWRTSAPRAFRPAQTRRKPRRFFAARRACGEQSATGDRCPIRATSSRLRSSSRTLSSSSWPRTSMPWCAWTPPRHVRRAVRAFHGRCLRGNVLWLATSPPPPVCLRPRAVAWLSSCRCVTGTPRCLRLAWRHLPRGFPRRCSPGAGLPGCFVCHVRRCPRSRWRRRARRSLFRRGFRRARA